MVYPQHNSTIMVFQWSKAWGILFLFLSMIIAAKPSFAQRSQIYTDSEKNFKEGIDLFQKQKFGAAQLAFESFLNSGEQKTDYAKSTASYYVAACAVELFHDNAEHLMMIFLQQYPHSNKVVLAYFQLGKLYFRQKEYKKAIVYFKKSDPKMLTKPEYFEYYYKLAYAEFIEEKFDEAQKNFSVVSKTANAFTIPATYYFAHIAYLKKNYEVALQEFLKIQKDKSFSRVIPFYVAQIYFLQGKYQEAVNYATPIVDTLKGKNLPLIRRLLAESYFELKDNNKCAQNYEAYVSLGAPLDRQGSYRLGITYYRMGKFKEAALNFKNTTSEDDLISQTAYYYLADCFIQSDSKRMALDVLKLAYSMKWDERIARESLFNFAKLSYELGYNPYNEAIDAINLYIASYPNAANIEEAYELMVNIYLHTQNYKDALVSLEKIKIKNSKLKIAEQRIYYFRAIELFNNLEFNNSILHFQKAIERSFDPRITAESKYWSGEARYRLKQYSQAKENYEDFLTSPSAKQITYYQDAYYNLGYAFLKLKKFAEAATEWRSYVSMNPENMKKKHDAYLRIGDCFFMQRNYSKAIEFYDQAIQINEFKNDYALYQKGLMQGLTDNHEGKSVSLQQALNQYPNTLYKDEILYELGLSYIRTGKINEAVTSFEAIVNSGNSSSLISRSYLQLGLIYFNSDKNREALGWYKRIVDEYPNTGMANEALKYIRNIYIELGDVDTYTQYVSGLKNVEISQGSLDSASYEAAENIVKAGDCIKGAEMLDKYINQFPKGIYLLDANHFKAECNYQQKEFDRAVVHYQYIIRQRKNIYTENAMNRLAFILESKADSVGLIEVYTAMEKDSETPQSLQKARIGLMRNYQKLSNCEKIIQYAKLVLTYDKLDEYVEEEAHYFMAVCYYNQQLMEEALSSYKKVYAKTSSEYDIEAGLKIGEILFQQAKYADAEKHLRTAIKSMGSDKHRLALSFILLSDIYVAMDNLPQAKSMLNTVISKHTGEDLILVAKQKLDQITEMEREKNQRKFEQEMILENQGDNGNN